MNKEAAIPVLESLIRQILEAEPLYFLVELRIKPVNQVQVFLDGDGGITIDKCVQFNRALYKGIEESNIFPGGDFSLEVSSPGLDEPLKLFRQYKKNIGRNIEILLLDGTKKAGKLVDLNEDGIIVEEISPKNGHRFRTAHPANPVSQTFLFNNIKTIKIQSVF
jgi:ribosome maturation factor RimP